MSNPDRTPYRLSLHEVSPLEVAWTSTTVLPNSEYSKLVGQGKETGYEDLAPTHPVSLQRVALGEHEASALVEHHADEDDQDLGNLAQQIFNDQVDSGLPEGLARHLTAVLVLGILIGRQEAQIFEDYSQQGIKDLNSPLGD